MADVARRAVVPNALFTGYSPFGGPP